MLIMGHSIAFQEYDKTLAEKLINVLSDKDNNKNCYIGLPPFLYIWGHTNEDKISRHHFFWLPICREAVDKYGNREIIYIDTQFGMPYVISGSRSLDYIESYYSRLKSMFKNKKLAIFAGETVFSKLKYDVFEEADDKEIILAPRINAWAAYEQIIKKALTYSKDTILCFILGPTATVLAYELSQKGYVAWDIGHMAKDYDRFRQSKSRGDNSAWDDFFAPD